MSLIDTVGRVSSPTPCSTPLWALQVKVVDLLAEVVVIQRYANTSDAPVEAEYAFPVHDRACLRSFEALIGERRIVGRVQKREEVR
jgi:Ca-activated chloride channel homolog